MPSEISNIKDVKFFSDGFELKGTLHLPTCDEMILIAGHR